MVELVVNDLDVSVDGTLIVKMLSLTVRSGEVVAVMGPNGSGKSTLVNALMGHPKYKIEKGTILLDGVDITTISVHERARRGLFLSFQYPGEVEGVTIANFLRTSLNAVRGVSMPVPQFMQLLKEKMSLLKMDGTFAQRYLNLGFSGGEKKKSEMLQLAVLEPAIALLDETDSGLDVDALRVVAEGVNGFVRQKNMGALLVTHYQRLLGYIVPDKVYVMVDGRIVASGGKELALQIEEKGYGWVKEEGR